MSKPVKVGLAYFPVDTHWDNDLSHYVISFGPEGLGHYILLLKSIYSNGYYLSVNIPVLAHALGVDAKMVETILDRCIGYNLFDKALFEKYNILTSRGIQKRWSFASSRRAEKNIKDIYNLLDKPLDTD